MAFARQVPLLLIPQVRDLNKHPSIKLLCCTLYATQTSVFYYFQLMIKWAKKLFAVKEGLLKEFQSIKVAKFCRLGNTDLEFFMGIRICDANFSCSGQANLPH